MEEIWKDIPGYEGRYQASSEGRIRSVDQLIAVISKNGKTYTRFHKGRIKTPTPNNSSVPYLTVGLGHKGCRPLVHRLVALAFLGPCPEGQEVRHLNNDFLDNRIANLAYGTHLENMADATRDERHRHRLTPDDVRTIRERINNGETNMTIAADYGVSNVVISTIRLGKWYRWVS